MPKADIFTIVGYKIDIAQSTISFDYETKFNDGRSERFVDAIVLPPVSQEQWDAVPPETLNLICEMLCLVVGTKYWKVSCAPEIRTRQFALSRQQAEFWNDFYTKGLGEFFFRAHMDFRGLVSFSYSENHTPARVSPFPRTQRALLAQSGGKDSVVSAELLLERNIPFDLFLVRQTAEQRKVAELIGKPVIAVRQITDAAYRARRTTKGFVPGYPSVSVQTCVAVLMAALFDYRYVIFSNEQSADVGNMDYLGLEVNHQWSKSSEAEALIRAYLSAYVTQDIVPFSLIRAYSEIEIVRRFANYRKYFYAFSSCNMNIARALSVRSATRPGRSYWCGTCPKCVFMFASLTAFLPLADVVEIFGKDLYEDPALLPIFRQLLGIEGFKPFECVGVPAEMIVAMSRAQGPMVGANSSPAMNLFKEYMKTHSVDLADLETEVFSPHATIVSPPADFSSLLPSEAAQNSPW